MKIRTPFGDYDYRVKRVAFRDGQLEVTGGLGEWETTMVIERSDLAELGRRIAPGIVLIATLGLVSRRRRRVAGI